MIETPKTRDESSLKLWISLFTVSFIILAILIYKFKKNYILNKNMYNFLIFLYIFLRK
ncbi:MAG: sortase B protein-sorting domain-containing protein [Clostridium sp.]|nr:sortase B protein-sorting domain-containing protein [Clostridium sp.]